MHAVRGTLTRKMREAQVRLRNPRFPFRSLGQGFLNELIRRTSRGEWDSDNMPMSSYLNRVMAQLWPYYGTNTYEGQILIQLADFAPVAQILVSAIETAVKIVHSDEEDRAEMLAVWLQQLQSERDQQMDYFEKMLQDPTRIAVEIGDEPQQVKLFTRLKHSVVRFGGVLTARELDVMSAVYDAVARFSDVVVVEVPEWFTKSGMDWGNAQVSTLSGGGEEECLRAVSILAELNHPNIRKFFGACHVGTPLIIHEKTLPIDSRDFSWYHTLDAACGLAYLHGRGLVHTTLSTTNIAWAARQHGGGKAVLSGINLVRVEDASKSQLVSRCARLVGDPSPNELPTGLANNVLQAYVEVVPAFGFHVAALGLALVSLTVASAYHGAVTYKRDRSRKRSARLGRCDPPCVRSDIHVFGFAIAEMMRTKANLSFRARRQLSRYLHARSLGPRPRNVSESVWTLLVGMCADDAADRMAMPHVVHNIDGLARGELGSGSSGGDTANPVIPDIESYAYNGQSISDMLQDAGALCEQLEEARCVHQSVLDRLVDIYQQLQNTVVKQIEVEDFVSIVLGFTRLLEDDDAIHQHIDRFLARRSLNSEAGVHHWYPDNRFEGRKQSEAHTAEADPVWFIPAHQIELGRHLANGSFGAVYQGAWLGSKVVVKQVLTDQTDAENRQQFKAELDLWFSLNHDHIIKLYGACHEHKPFFVCERATCGTLTSFVKGKERLEIWRYIHQASLGLCHLHDHGIVHGDLKGNNILVCDDGVKLADFGMSFIVNRQSTAAASSGALGAYRWKAPECLSGGSPTFASDVYSFGVCIVEALTGQVPWGSSMPEPAVRYNVVELKQFVPRPDALNDTEWSLILRMCCFDASRRISAAAVANYADELVQPRQSLMKWGAILTTNANSAGTLLNMPGRLLNPLSSASRRPKCRTEEAGWDFL